MPDMVLYHNPRWGKSRGAVSLLKDKNIDFTIVEYLKTPLTEDEVMSLSKKLGKPLSDFVRRSERDFKDNQLNQFLGDNNKMAECVAKFPKIMERPIFVKGDRAVIGRPPEQVLLLLDK